MSMSFWERFSRLCDDKHMSPRAVARQLDIPEKTLKQWQGGIWPHGQNLKKLMDFFGVPADMLLSTPEYNMTFSPSEKPSFTEKEWQFIHAYRQKVALRPMIDKLLDVTDDTER